VRRLSEGKNYFLGEMKKLGFATLNGGGNFLHVAFAEKAEKIHAALDSIVLYRKNFTEPCLKGFSRFSSTTVEQFKPIVEAIRAAC
jgi:histidinol-phosphate aminotransferase